MENLIGCNLVQHTNEYLQGLYEYYNEEIFDCKLPNIPVTYEKKSKKNRIILGITYYSYSTVISINICDNYIFSNENELLNVLIHEMIHVKLIHSGNYLESHGTNFIKELNRINKDFNMHLDTTFNSNINLLSQKKTDYIITSFSRPDKYMMVNKQDIIAAKSFYCLTLGKYDLSQIDVRQTNDVSFCDICGGNIYQNVNKYLISRTMHFDYSDLKSKNLQKTVYLVYIEEDKKTFIHKEKNKDDALHFMKDYPCNKAVLIESKNKLTKFMKKNMIYYCTLDNYFMIDKTAKKINLNIS